MPLFSPTSTVSSSGTVEIAAALSDETTTLTSTGNPKLTMRMPCGMTLTGVRSSLTAASSSGLVTVDINIEGSTILSTKLSIDQGEETSTTATTPAVISTVGLWDDAEMTFDIDAAGTGAKGLKVTLIGTRADIAVPADLFFLPRAVTNTTYAGGRTTTTITRPSGTINGDIVLLGILTGNATEAVDPTPPAGYTLITGFPNNAERIGFEVETRVYYKVASGEPASWDFTHSSAASQGFAVAIPNGNAGTPIDVNASVSNGNSTVTTGTGITTVTDGAMVFYVAHDWGVGSANLSPPTSSGVTYTELIDVAPLLYVAYGIKATAGATGNTTQTNNNSTTDDGWGASLFALRPG